MHHVLQNQTMDAPEENALTRHCPKWEVADIPGRLNEEIYFRGIFGAEMPPYAYGLQATYKLRLTAPKTVPRSHFSNCRNQIVCAEDVSLQVHK